MNKTLVTKQVKIEILTICAAPIATPDKLTDNIALALLGYDEYENWCRQLENRLQYIATEFQTGKQIAAGNITPDTTVNQCIQMVI